MTESTKWHLCPACEVKGRLIDDQLNTILECENQNCRVRFYWGGHLTE